MAIKRSTEALKKLWVCMVVLLCFILVPFLSSAAEQPRRGGTLVVAVVKDPSTLNPALTAGMDTHHTMHQVYEGLTELDGNMNPQPGLARSWEVSPDGLTITFRLAENARWHDGKPFTSKDVQFGLMGVAGKYNPMGRIVMANVRSIETPNDHTAVFRMKKVYGPLILAMAPFNCPIVPRHLYEGTDILKNPHNISNPVGTGPFKFKEWVKGDHITLVRNNDYYKPGFPYLDRIIFKTIRDATSRALAFEKGEVDLMPSGVCSVHDYQRLAKLPNVTTSQTPGDQLVVLVAFNQHDNKIVANLKVRQAIYHAIDRQFISDKVRYGLNPPLDSAIPRVYKSFHDPDVKKYEYNLAKANKLLDEAGYPRDAKGIRFDPTLVYEHGQAYGIPETAQILKPMLKKVGIDVKLVSMERPVMFEKAFKNYEFEMFLTSYGTKSDPAIGVSRTYHTKSILGKPFTNVARYSNPEVDRLFDEAAASMDVQKRARLYHKVQRILAEELPYIWLYSPGNMDTSIAKSTFKGVFQRINSPKYTMVWWAGGK